MENNRQTYGKAMIGLATATPKELAIIDFVQVDFADHRIVSVTELEDGTYCLSVENPVFSGRAPHQTMRLGKESFAALIFSAHLFCQGKGIDLPALLDELAVNDQVQFNYSPGVQNPIPPYPSDKVGDDLTN